jgi:hypothetical protein
MRLAATRSTSRVLVAWVGCELAGTETLTRAGRASCCRYKCGVTIGSTGRYTNDCRIAIYPFCNIVSLQVRVWVVGLDGVLWN